MTLPRQIVTHVAKGRAKPPQGTSPSMDADYLQAIRDKIANTGGKVIWGSRTNPL